MQGKIPKETAIERLLLVLLLQLQLAWGTVAPHKDFKPN